MNLGRLDLCFRYWAGIFIYLQEHTEYSVHIQIFCELAFLIGDKIVDIYIRRNMSVRYAQRYESQNLTISPHKG